MDGKFYGPNAAEFGAAFTLDLPASASQGGGGASSTFAGVTVGKKD
jgi:hypothetical protein